MKAAREAMLAFMNARRARIGLAFAILALATEASGQPRPRPSEPVGVPPDAPVTNLRGRFGMELVRRLMRAPSADDRLRAVRRAAELGTPEAIALLASQAEGNPALRTDPRALIELSRALAPHAAEDGPRAALTSILVAPTTAATRAPKVDGEGHADPALRFELARQTAALALARGGTQAATDALFLAVRAQGLASEAAALGLATYPPLQLRGLGAAGQLSATLVAALAATGDLRANDVLLLALKTSEPRTRAAALILLARSGDERALDSAKTFAKDANPTLRQAAATALVALGAKEAPDAVKALLADEGSAPAAIELAPQVENEDIVKVLASRATLHPVFSERTSAIFALSRCRSPLAPKTLGTLVSDRSVESEASQALGRSRSPSARVWLRAMLRAPHARRLGIRAYALRVLRGGDREPEADAIIGRLATDSDPANRAVAVFARVALGDASVEKHLSDSEAGVRIAAVLGARGRMDDGLRRSLLARLASDRSPAARVVYAAALDGGDPEGAIPTGVLVHRAESGEPDASLAAFALARRSEEEPSVKIRALLSSGTPWIRAHALLGLADSRARDVSGRLATAYTYEPDPATRRTLIRALARRTGDASAPIRSRTLTSAARVDPDPEVRFMAARALSGFTTARAEGTADEVAWLRILLPDGAAPSSIYTGALITTTGAVIPLAFDADGYALVPHVPPGEARLVLAPRVPSHEAHSP